MNDARTVDSVFRQAAKAHGNLPYLLFPHGGEVTYADIYESARRLAGAMQRAGIEPGDRVVSLLGNCRALYEFYIATSMAGAIAVPINIQSTVFEIERLIADCSPKGCVADAGLLDRLGKDPFEGFQLRLLVGGEHSGWNAYAALDGAALEQPLSTPDAAMLIIYSSGTTGNPKGIVLRHSGVIGNCLRVMERLEHTPSDRFITLLPSFHLFGYNFEFLKAALVHSPIVVMPEFDADRALQLIARHRVTVLHTVPTMISRLFEESLVARHDISSIRLVYTGGGPVSPELKRRLKEVICVEVSEGFGQTECSAGATIQPIRVDLPFASCGPPLRDFRLKIVDPQDSEVPVGETGEILVQSPTIMVGYWNQPELTAHTLRGGWLHTGDVGRFDAEGNLYILDRLKDMLVSNGFNVFPKELENAILSHPAVQLAAVVGFPDEIRGDMIHAFVTLKGDVAVPDLNALAGEIMQHARERLARYKWPRSVTILSELPTTATGKVRRFKLREMPDTALGATQLGRAGDPIKGVGSAAG
jgi:acyl-CoA synthetase (AMP-forming)/AMP-acid ligase II